MKTLNAFKRNKKHQIVVFNFLLQILGFGNKEDQLGNVVPDVNTMNASLTEQINSY